LQRKNRCHATLIAAAASLSPPTPSHTVPLLCPPVASPAPVGRGGDPFPS
jgi:hypothetical protein